VTVEELWRRYAASWSLREGREEQLGACVAEDVTYCDPGAQLEGRVALSDYMRSFQASAPGATFAIRSVRDHHRRSLAHWTLAGPSGDALQTGTSFAIHGADGRLQHITGFFGGTERY
jgi:hypothetical protein